MNTHYMSGFANEFATEALQRIAKEPELTAAMRIYGLYAEQISGTAFTAPRHSNRRSWTYRIRPAAMHQPFVQIDNGNITNDFFQVPSSPNQLRWDPQPLPSAPTDFIEGWFDDGRQWFGPMRKPGLCNTLYAASKDMTDKFFTTLMQNC